MHPKVIEEVVPFAEEEFARRVVALQQLHVALRPRVSVLKNPELLGGRNLLFDTDGIEVKILAKLNLDSHICRDFFSDHRVMNLIAQEKHYPVFVA